MGTDKALLDQDGVPMAVFLLDVLERAGFEASLIRRGEEATVWRMPDGRPVRVVREADDGARHPLNGVLTALDDAGAAVVVIPCDLPQFTVEAARSLRSPGVAVGERMHPLVAHVPASLRGAVAQGIQDGASAQRVLGHLPPIPLDPDVLWDRNHPV